ncbi:hypothetical protein PSAL_027430 [Pseudooceanicola algae]|uniref:Capsule polysaccharide biosynthesis protein n=2 Tax=Pseudooceanicola algae TaxID=1537215 RepID=A0A418SBP6_9RHOB|nr:hypothetical protein PSAL_027430 [Pseudooceanicola algae]
MDQTREMRIYLDPVLARSAGAGEHNFLNLVTGVLREADFRVEICETGPEARALAPRKPGHALFHMEQPTHDRALVFRRVYHYPFWAIEPYAERWQWRVAQTPFPAAEVNRNTAKTFFDRWQTKLFGAAANDTSRDGFVYVPLQGRLLNHRSFQSCAPVEMLERILDADPVRRILVTLHPKETYSPDELSAVEKLSRKYPRLSLTKRPMQDCLQHCDYVAAENSSVAFSGYFFRKPALLFAQIDFHHIALGPDDFDRVAHHAPDYEGYIWWFWQRMSINAGREDAPQKIANALRRCGVPLSRYDVTKQ